MFKEMRRNKQQLDNLKCIEVLTTAPRGVMAVIGTDEYPYAFPMNHLYMDGKLYFHCARVGYKLDSIEKNNKVSFCVMDNGYKKEGEWSLNITSVIVFGTIKKIEDPEIVLKVLKELGKKHYPSISEVDKEIELAISRVQILELTIEQMSGKLVNES